RLSIDETAAALNSPERAEDGVWSLLAQLGIGVYTADGHQIMPGSETSEADFWLYDFELPALAEMAQGAPVPFERYASLLTAAGVQGAPSSLIANYREVYARHPDHPLVELFAAMGLDFEPGLQLTPLQEWLLLLDTFIPPNPIGNALDPGSARRASRLPPSQSLQAVCGAIQGGNIIPYWGLMQSESGWAALIQARESYYAIHGPMIAQAARYALEASGSSAHEGHNGKGDRLEYTVRVQVNYQPWQMIPVAGVACGALENLDFKVLSDGLSSVPVEWSVPGVFYAHGELEEQDPLTDSSGEARLNFQAQEEEAAGIGPYKEETDEVSARLDLRSGFMANGIVDPRLLDFVPASVTAGPAPVQVSWHETCDHFTIWFNEELHQAVSVYSNDILIEGPISVRIYPGGDPATLEGSGTLPITGGGQAGDCRFTNSGVDQVTVTGTALPGVGEEPPTLKMTIEHAFQITVAGSQCGGGSPVPIPGGGGEIEMPFRDGEMVGGPFSQPTVSGLTTYTLEVACLP
ncbi:MAG: hypothetical protein ACK2TX_00505, partial [Anaerolineales bacterium]